MDTVYSLVGKIGRPNLSRQASKRLQELKETNENYALLDKALKESEDETEKAQIEVEHRKAGAYITKQENALLHFLNDEYEDILDKQAKAEAKVKAEEEAQAEAQAQAEEEAQAEAQAKAEAEAEAEAEAQAKAEAEAEAKAQAQGVGHSATTAPPEREKKSSITGGIIIGALLTLFGLGAYMYNRNK